MSIKLLTEHHLELISLKGGYTGLFESTLVKIPHCRKSQVVAQMGFDAGKPGPEVIKLEYSLKLKINRNDWLLADTCPPINALFLSLRMNSSL